MMSTRFIPKLRVRPMPRTTMLPPNTECGPLTTLNHAPTLTPPQADALSWAMGGHTLHAMPAGRFGANGEARWT